MWKPIQAPGEWLLFLQRKDIKGLPIMEARKKYMQEQLLYEGYINNLNTVNTVNSTTSAPASAAAGGGGGFKRYSYKEEFELLFKGTGDESVVRSGRYRKVLVSNLKQYWYDNFWDDLTREFSVPPPSLGNISADYFFIKNGDGENTEAYIITWGAFGRGRPRGQWTFSEYRGNNKIPSPDCGQYNNWNVIGVGNGGLDSPVGKYKITNVEASGVLKAPCTKNSVPYELINVEIDYNTLIVTGDEGVDSRTGKYVRVSGEGEDAVYSNNSFQIFTTSECGTKEWRIDDEDPVNCDYFSSVPDAKTGPTGEYTRSIAREGENRTYTVEYDIIRPPSPQPDQITLTIFNVGNAGNTDTRIFTRAIPGFQNQDGFAGRYTWNDGKIDYYIYWKASVNAWDVYTTIDNSGDIRTPVISTSTNVDDPRGTDTKTYGGKSTYDVTYTITY